MWVVTKSRVGIVNVLAKSSPAVQAVLRVCIRSQHLKCPSAARQCSAQNDSCAHIYSHRHILSSLALMGTNCRVLERLQREMRKGVASLEQIFMQGVGSISCTKAWERPCTETHRAGGWRTSASGAVGSKTLRDLNPSLPFATSWRTCMSLFRYADISTCTMGKERGCSVAVTSQRR